MEIRQLRMDEFEERMALSQFAFQLRFDESNMEQRRKTYRPEHDWGAFDENGKLLSAAIIIPFEAWVQGRKLAMGGIAGVATWPDARRQGCVSKLLSHALETMKKDGHSISMLHPFSFPFYRKFGWEMTVERKKYTIPTRLLPARLYVPGLVKRVAKPDFEALNRVYSAYASRYSGTLARNDDWWENKILTKNGTWAVYENESGQTEGYVFYDVADSKLTVHDMANTTEKARVALWTYIANHDSMIEEATLIAPIDDPLPFLLSDPRIKQEILPYFMSRIVDAEAFVRQYAWAPGTDGESVALRIADAQAPWNDGLFRLDWSSNGEGKLARTTEQEESANGTISCDIQALTAMLLGNRRPAFLREYGRIVGSDTAVALLEKRVPPRTTHLMDFF
ncbi:enhanced intracellular survival protein Eis [Cohnella suwonensis]|uniref:Enhanced intracellular survival protein Eis n=1 Tax=Cohnella suwonensis TaxID=696072 RepID=A0ABW0M080_9BACL